MKTNIHTMISPSINNEAGPEKKRQKLEGILSSFDRKAKATFENLHGCELASEQLKKIVDRFLRSIAGNTRKSRWPTLICGSRGLGKTSVVEAAADYANLKLVQFPMRVLIEQTRNEFKTTLKLFISYCISVQPALVLIDDLELIKDREDMRHLLRTAVDRLLEDETSLLIFCTATSIVDETSGIDFLVSIHLKRPSYEARLKILKHLRDNNKTLVQISSSDLEDLASRTPSFTAADLMKMFDIAETESSNYPNIMQCIRSVNLVCESFKRGTHLIGEKPSVTWDHIGGLPEVRRAFLDILKQVRDGDMTCKFAGIALYGPPGCGKTMVAQAMANEAGFNFISIKPAELVDKFLGETEKNIRRVFAEAREYEPCMIYFDEFDGLCGTRGNRDTVTSAIQTLLSEIDGFAGRGHSIILASTNRLEDIDPAMKRPGRLSKHIYVGPPDQDARREILKVIAKRYDVSLSPKTSLDVWAKRTENFSGADLEFLITEAQSRARLEQYDSLANESVSTKDRPEVDHKHLEFAFDKIKMTNKELFKKLNGSL